MPLPTPNQNENSKDFHSRCMGNETMKKEYPDQKQRNAVCYSQWDRSKNKTESVHELPNLASRIFNTPLLITMDKLNEILGVLGPRMHLTNPADLSEMLLTAPAQRLEVENRPLYQLIGRTAIVSISGTLVYKGGFISSLSGLCSYDNIRKVMNSAMDAADVDAVITRIDSNGGEGAGLFDLVDYLTSLRSKKPIIGIADERALSAAYAIISTAHEVYVSRTAMVGSIGAVAVFKDISQALEKAGIKVTAIYSGKHKVDYASFKPISEEAFNRVQANVDKLRDIFVETVAKNNGITEQEVRDTEAAVYVGEDAVTHKLANAVIPYDGVISYVTQKFNKKGGFKMPRETKFEGDVLEGLTQDDVISAKVEEAKVAMQAEFDAKLATKLQEAKNAADVDHATKLEAAITEALKNDRVRIETIIGACASAHLPELALDHITKGTSVSDVNSILLSVLAAKSESTTIITSNNPSQGELSSNPLIKDAKMRAEQAAKSV